MHISTEFEFDRRDFASAVCFHKASTMLAITWLMDSSRVPYCPAIANGMPAIQSIATMCDEWPGPKRLHSRRHLLPTTRDFPVAAANVFPNRVQCMSIRKTDIRSVKQNRWKNIHVNRKYK